MAQVIAGSVVAGRYELERCTGVGSAGSIWRAQDLETGLPCTIRLADRSSVPPAELSALYRSEAEASARVRCDNVLDVLALGDSQECPYLVFEHVEGEALTSHLRRRGRMDPPVAYAVISQIGRALARAHSAGIVHGDLKPDQVLLSAVGEQLVVKVLGFGVAEATSQASSGGAVSLGAAFGLPFYASPERVSRKPLDGRSDLWSLAMIGYECLTGVRPFRSHALGELVKLVRGDSVPALKPGRSEPTAALAAWWQTACARKPAERYQSARAMIEELGRALELAPAELPEAVLIVEDRPSVPDASWSSRPPAPTSELPRPVRASEPPGVAQASEPPRPGKASERPGSRTSEPPRPVRASEPPRRVKASERPGVSRTSEPPRPVKASEPPRVAQVSEPPRPGKASERPGVAQASEPPRPVKASEPPGVAQASEPPRPVKASEPPGVAQASEPPRPGKASEPPGVAQASEPPRPVKASEPPGVAQASEPPRPVKASEPPGVARASEPPGVAQASDPPGVSRTSESPGPVKASEPPRCGEPSDPPRAVQASEPSQLFGDQAPANAKGTLLGIGEGVKTLIDEWGAIPGLRDSLPDAATSPGVTADSLGTTRLGIGQDAATSPGVAADSLGTTRSGIGEDVRAVGDQSDRSRAQRVTAPPPEGLADDEISSDEAMGGDESTARQSSGSLRALLAAETKTQPPPGGGHDTLDGIGAPEAGGADDSVPGWTQGPQEESLDDSEEEGEAVDGAQLLAHKHRQRRLRVAVSAFLGGLVVLAGAVGVTRMGPSKPADASSPAHATLRSATARPVAVPSASKDVPAVVDETPPKPSPQVVLVPSPEPAAPEAEGEDHEETVAVVEAPPPEPSPAAKEPELTPRRSIASQPASKPGPRAASKPKPAPPKSQDRLVSVRQDYGI